MSSNTNTTSTSVNTTVNKASTSTLPVNTANTTSSTLNATVNKTSTVVNNKLTPTVDNNKLTPTVDNKEKKSIKKNGSFNNFLSFNNNKRKTIIDEPQSIINMIKLQRF